MLACAGLQLGVTTAGRILKENPFPAPQGENERHATGPDVTAKYHNHVWYVDLTANSTGAGLWCRWLPFALPQRWPFCWWVMAVIDHFSRHAMGAGVFVKRPD